jgi:hypothetical protein
MTDTSSKKLRMRPCETAQFCSFLMDDGQPPPTSEEGWKIPCERLLLPVYAFGWRYRWRKPVVEYAEASAKAAKKPP